MRVHRWLLLGVVLVLCVLSERWLNAQPFVSGVGVSARRVAHVTRVAPRTPPRSRLSAVQVASLPTVPAAPTPALAGNFNVLLVGLDRRPGATSGGRPDTIIVASFSEEQGRLGLVSIPRDLYVEIPGFGFDRINATAAAATKLREDPGELLKRVVESTLEISIAHSVVIDLGGFERAIDAIGGVEVDVPCAIADNFVDSRQPNQRRALDVDAGWQHMNGTTAAMYVRSRHGRSDWSRARRQQAVLLGIKRRLLSAQGLTRVPALLDGLQSLVTTELSRAEMLQLSARVLRLEPENVHGLVIGYQETEGHRTPDGKSVLLPKPAAIRAKLDTLFSARAPGALPEHASCPGKEVALEHVSEAEVASPAAPLATEAPSAATSEASRASAR